MSKTYECHVRHTVHQGETIIQVKVRENPTYTGCMAVRVEAGRAEDAVMKALREVIITDG